MSSPRDATLVAIRNWILPRPEVGQRLVALALREAAVQRRDVSALAGQDGGQPVHPDLGVTEDEEPIEPELVGQLGERRDLVLLGDEVDQLAHRLDGPHLRPHDDVLGLLVHEPIADAQDRVRHGGGEERRLAVARAARQDRLDVDDEAHVEHPVGLVEDDGVHPVEAQLAAPDEVEDAARACRPRPGRRASGRSPGGPCSSRRRWRRRRRCGRRRCGGSPRSPARTARGSGSAPGPARTRPSGSTFSTIGMPKAAVLPVPVCAWPIRSLPARSGPMARAWTSVGAVKPIFSMARAMVTGSSISPNRWERCAARTAAIRGWIRGRQTGDCR